jgi:hypothetical protein
MIRRLLPIALVLAVLPGCAGQPEPVGEGEACAATSDCQESLQCIWDLCQVPLSMYESCRMDTDCITAACLAGMCSLPCTRDATGVHVGDCVQDPASGGGPVISDACSSLSAGYNGCCAITAVDSSARGTCSPLP